MELAQAGARILANDMLVVILHAQMDDPDEVSSAIAAVNHTEVLGLWPVDLTFVAFEMVDDPDAEDGLCMLGITKEGIAVELLDRGELRAEHIGVTDERTALLGPITDMTEVGGRALAVGMGCTAWLRTGFDAWTCIDEDIRAPEGQGGFTRVCATGLDSAAAVGLDGLIAHFDGTRWSRIEGPTTRHLFAITRCPDGVLYAGGAGRVLLRGHAEDWQEAAIGGSEETIWSLLWFPQGGNGRLYAACSDGLYVLEGNALVPVPVTDASGLPLLEYGGHGTLVGLDDRLYYVQPEQLLFTRDGHTWERLDPYTNL